MKRAIYLAILLIAMTAVTACNLDGIIDSGRHHNNDNGVVIVKDSVTPACVQDFVNTHFNGIAIKRVKIDYNDYDYYDVRLANGYELEFSRDCEWLDVDCNRNAVPQSVLDLLPANITQYISANYANHYVRSINKERHGYEIELNGGLELEFDSDGNFIRIDR